MRVLVTGGTGFIGRHLVSALVAAGHTVSIAGRRPRHDLPAGALPAAAGYHACDLSAPGHAAALLADTSPQWVFNLASAVDVSRELHMLEVQVRATLMSALHLAQACLHGQVERLVHVGTCEEYGNGPAPFRESQDPMPVSPYSAAKVAATAFVRMLCTSFGLRAVVIRPFLTYGPGQGPNQLIPALIQSALVGKDFPMTAGEQTREFNYVADIAEGLMLAATAPGVEGMVINLGCAEPRRICDVAAQVIAQMGNPVSLQLGKLPYRPGETWEFYCDNTLARERLGWQPRTSLEAGLERTIAWYRQQRRG